MPKLVTAFGGTETLQAFPEERPEPVDAATAGRADDRLQLGEAAFAGVKVGTVRRQIPQGRVGLLDGAADGDVVAVEDQRAVGVAARPSPRQGAAARASQ